MEHMAWKGRIKPGCKAEYQRRHAEIWPEMVKVLKEAGICNYSIFYCKDELFGYYECEKGVAYVQLCDLCIGHRIACQITARIFYRDDPVDAVGRSVIGACFGNAALLHGDGILGLVALQRIGCALGCVDERTGTVCACHSTHSYVIGQLIRLVISERRQPCDRKAPCRLRCR